MIDEPFRGTEAIARGLLTEDRLYGPSFRRLFPDVYLPADHELDLATRSRAAYLLVLDRGGVLAGYSAAHLLGADCAPRTAPAEVMVPRFHKSWPGLRVRYGVAAAADLVRREDCLVTGPGRTAWDLARRLPLVEAVVVVDALARRTTFRPADLLERRAQQRGARNCRRLDDVVALADPRAESPGETRLRVRLVRAGLPPPQTQHVIVDEYGFELARADLAYPEAKLAIEYDGDVHFDRRGGQRDRQRDVILAGYGWLTVRFVRDDLDAAQTPYRVEHLLRTRR